MQLTYGPRLRELIAEPVHRRAHPLLPIDAATGLIVPPQGGPVEVRAWIRELTEKLLALPVAEKREFEVKHTFLNGMYMRELFIPKGSLLIGKIHKLPCLNVVSKGDISVLTESGSARVTAGYSVQSPAGIQKVGYAHEDTVFINVFRTDETDAATIEDAIAFDSYEAAQITHEGVFICQ